MKKTIVVILLMGMIPALANAQAKVSGHAWTGLDVKYGVGKRIQFQAAVQGRFNTNLFQRRSTFADFGVKVKLWKWMALRPTYRLTRMPEINNDRERYTLDFLFKTNIDKFRLSYRLRPQYSRNLNKVGRRFTLRNKIGVGYNLSKLVDPKVTWEHFVVPERGAEQRFKFNLVWRVEKNIELTTFYALEREINRKFNDVRHIAGVTASLKTGVKRKKKKKDD